LGAGESFEGEGGFAEGFGGFGGVFEGSLGGLGRGLGEVEGFGEGGDGEGPGAVVDGGLAGGVDAVDALEGALIGLGLGEGVELGEGEVVLSADVEGETARVEEVLEEVVGEVGCVHCSPFGRGLGGFGVCAWGRWNCIGGGWGLGRGFGGWGGRFAHRLGECAVSVCDCFFERRGRRAGRRGAEAFMVERGEDWNWSSARDY
jgi:hypothetical protein